MGIRGELFSTKVALQNRTYFFNVKENRLGDLYLNIVESKNRETGGFERQSVILFADDLKEFLFGFEESLKVMEKASREKRKGENPRGGGSRMRNSAEARQTADRMPHTEQRASRKPAEFRSQDRSYADQRPGARRPAVSQGPYRRPARPSFHGASPASSAEARRTWDRKSMGAPPPGLKPRVRRKLNDYQASVHKTGEESKRIRKNGLGPSGRPRKRVVRRKD